MLVSAKILFLTFAVVGVAATGAAAVDSPMMKAIQIHESHLGADSTIPDQAVKGQQNSYDRLMMAQEKFLAGNHTWTPDEDPVDTDAIMLA
jgi:hypothetical protein